MYSGVALLFWQEYFTTAVLECFSTVSRVNVYHPGEMVDILHSHLLIDTDDYCHLFMFYVCFYVMTGPHVKQPVADELSCINMF